MKRPRFEDEDFQVPAPNSKRQKIASVEDGLVAFGGTGQGASNWIASQKDITIERLCEEKSNFKFKNAFWMQ